jgi:hypothetical protein
MAWLRFYARNVTGLLALTTPVWQKFQPGFRASAPKGQPFDHVDKFAQKKHQRRAVVQHAIRNQSRDDQKTQGKGKTIGQGVNTLSNASGSYMAAHSLILRYPQAGAMQQTVLQGLARGCDQAM